MGMVIGQANSIRFRKVDSNLPSFDNTLTQNEKFYNDRIFTYCQRWLTTDTVIVQIKSDSATVPTVIATKADNSEVVITASPVSSYDQDGDSVNDLFFFTFSVVMSGYTTESYITVTQGAVVYRSEPFKGDAELSTELTNGEVMKIEYFNIDNAFQLDFSSEAGSLTFTLYVESIVKELGFGGESSIYDNQSELTKLKETVQRTFVFNTLDIPRYIAETLKLASSMDNFVVNDVSYVRQEEPELSPIDGSNLVTYSMILNDKEYLGVNSHDIGFSADTPISEGEVMILTVDAVSGSQTFSVPAGYLVHTMRAQWVSGTSVEVKLGTSVGGSQLLFPFVITSSITDSTGSVHADIDRDATTNIYATITGGVANLDVQLIQNTQ